MKKGERSVNQIESKGKALRACISWEMGLCNSPTIKKTFALLSQDVSFKDLLKF